MKRTSSEFVSDSEIINEIARRTKLPRKDVKMFLENLVKFLFESLEDGKNVKFKEFGKIVVKYVAPRDAMDLIRKKKIRVCAKNKAVFVPCQRLKDELDYGTELEGFEYSTRMELPSSRDKVVKRLSKWIDKNDAEKEKLEKRKYDAT